MKKLRLRCILLRNSSCGSKWAEGGLLSVSERGVTNRVSFAEILYVEADGHYVCLKVLDKELRIVPCERNALYRGKDRHGQQYLCIRGREDCAEGKS